MLVLYSKWGVYFLPIDYFGFFDFFMFQLIINFKSYKESLGENATKIANAILKLNDVASKKNVRIVACPQIIDLRDIVKKNITVFSQHMDPYEQGAHTGFLVAEELVDAGVKGILINHTEHRVDTFIIEEEIKKAKAFGLETCVCAQNEIEVEVFSKLAPDFIAVEPPELIGGDISISSAQPGLIIKSVNAAGKVPLLIGAGIKNYKDVEIGIGLGAKGILVASGIVKDKNIDEAILDLLQGF